MTYPLPNASEPVDTDAMRKIANYADWIVRQPGEGPLIRAAADEIDRLRARLSQLTPPAEPTSPCPRCIGMGHVGLTDCHLCHGTGKVS